MTITRKIACFQNQNVFPSYVHSIRLSIVCINNKPEKHNSVIHYNTYLLHTVCSCPSYLCTCRAQTYVG